MVTWIVGRRNICHDSDSSGYMDAILTEYTNSARIIGASTFNTVDSEIILKRKLRKQKEFIRQGVWSLPVVPRIHYSISQGEGQGLF